MNSESPSPFDDPVLKAALKRNLGTERAPASLRARVERALAAETAATMRRAAHRPSGWRNSPLVGIAAAALFIVGIGLIFNNYWRTDTGRAELPKQMALDMAAAHDRALASGGRHELDVPKDDLNAIRNTLKDKLGHPVLVASLGNDWQFQGARVAKVGTTDAAELVFKSTTSADSVSVFSVPGQAYYATEEGLEYKQVADGHPIAGWVKNGIVHCVVGSKGSKLDTGDLVKLRDSIKKFVSDGSQSNATQRGPCAERSSLAKL